MKIVVENKPEFGDKVITITMSREFMAGLTPSNFRHLIKDDDERFGIIEDAVLLAMGYEYRTPGPELIKENPFHIPGFA